MPPRVGGRQPAGLMTMTSCACQGTGRCLILANEAASSPRNTAAAAAASATCASSARSAAADATASAASASSAASYSPSAASAASCRPPSATPLGNLHAGQISFSVENKERPQADVRDFLFIENKLRYGIQQMHIRCRSDGSCCGCAGHRYGHADDSRNRYGLLQMR